jgi:hypothetical protein
MLIILIIAVGLVVRWKRRRQINAMTAHRPSEYGVQTANASSDEAVGLMPTEGDLKTLTRKPRTSGRG